MKNKLLFFFMNLLFSVCAFTVESNEVIIPKGLKPGDTIGLV